MHEIIPLHRAQILFSAAQVKVIAQAKLARRFVVPDKAPSKQCELRPNKPQSRMAGRECSALDGISHVKFAARPRRAAKLRLFRLWKLFDGLKQKQKGVEPEMIRPLGDRLRRLRGGRRL